MANRIKGITVEIGGDTTKLSKALEGVNKNIKNTQTQLKDVQKLLKLDPKNTELIRPAILPVTVPLVLSDNLRSISIADCESFISLPLCAEVHNLRVVFRIFMM